MNRDGGAYSLPTAYDRLLVTHPSSCDQKPDEACHWRAKRCNYLASYRIFNVDFKNIITRIMWCYFKTINDHAAHPTKIYSVKLSRKQGSAVMCVRLRGKCMYSIQFQQLCHLPTKIYLKFEEIWRSSDSYKNAQFFETRRTVNKSTIQLSKQRIYSLWTACLYHSQNGTSIPAPNYHYY